MTHPQFKRTDAVGVTASPTVPRHGEERSDLRFSRPIWIHPRPPPGTPPADGRKVPVPATLAEAARSRPKRGGDPLREQGAAIYLKTLTLQKGGPHL
jgi:hypothetical protein